jgi:hypothetical protein
MSEIAGVASVVVVESYDLKKREIVKRSYNKAVVKLGRVGTSLRIARSEVITAQGSPVKYQLIESISFEQESLKKYGYSSSTYIDEIPIDRTSFLVNVQKLMSLTKESDQYKYDGISRLVDEERQSEATSTVRLVSSDYEGLRILKSIEVDSSGNVVE